MHLDEHDPNLLHLYLLSYERHSLVAHFKIAIDGAEIKQASNQKHSDDSSHR